MVEGRPFRGQTMRYLYGPSGEIGCVLHGTTSSIGSSSGSSATTARRRRWRRWWRSRQSTLAARALTKPVVTTETASCRSYCMAEGHKEGSSPWRQSASPSRQADRRASKLPGLPACLPACNEQVGAEPAPLAGLVFWFLGDLTKWPFFWSAYRSHP